jgi:hypothetical protein
MYQSMKLIAAAVVFGGLMSVFTIESRAADSACKGLAQDNCGTQGCSWVKAYKTSKGKDIAAFCRKKPERKSTTTSAAVAPKS